MLISSFVSTGHAADYCLFLTTLHPFKVSTIHTFLVFLCLHVSSFLAGSPSSQFNAGIQERQAISFTSLSMLLRPRSFKCLQTCQQLLTFPQPHPILTHLHITLPTWPSTGMSSTNLKLTWPKQNSWFSPKLLNLSKQHYNLTSCSTEIIAVILHSSFPLPSLIQCFLQNTFNVYSLFTIPSPPMSQSSWPWMIESKSLPTALPAFTLAS